MPTVLGSIFNAAFVHGLELFESIYPMPARLGTPLPAAALARRRDPVVLIGGFANSARGWNEWRRSLDADGFDVHVIELPSRGLGDMYASARHVAAEIERIKRQTGRRRVDLVGFSEGGLLARMYVAHHAGEVSVDRIVTLATPHNGVKAYAPLVDAVRAIPLLKSALPESASQLMRGSALLRELDRLDVPIRARGRVRYASVYSRIWDGVITPAAATLRLGTNVPVTEKFLLLANFGPTHFGMYHLSSGAYEAARSLLLDHDASRTPAPVRDARVGVGDGFAPARHARRRRALTPR